MSSLSRVVLSTVAIIVLGARIAAATPITVAEFRWDVTLDDTPGCSVADPTCVVSTFSLTGLWDGPRVAPTLTDNQVSLADGSSGFFFDVDSSFGFDQFALPGLPSAATLTTSFLFKGELKSLAATISAPATASSSAVLSFSPASSSVPEPGTLGLLAVGAGVLLACKRRFAGRQR